MMICLLRSSLPLALIALLVAAGPLAAQAPAQPAPSGPAQPQAQQAPAPTPDTDMTSPPVVDPKGVDTQPVPPAAAPQDNQGAAAAPANPLDKPDGFGEAVDMKPVPVLQKRGQSGWDEGFASIVAALKEVDTELTRLKLKAAGPPLIIYTSTDDAGFDFEAAIPFSGATTEKPGVQFELAASPAGKALRFTHRGSYEAMDPTYEQIANLLDAKDLEAQDLYIEEYRSDPRTTSQDDMVIDIYVPLK
ncbi:MAG: transcriptional activator ligand binding domain protein [Xanthobacteraceae bacterium]|jgi:effector-binding domain-containing protein|nr:transcriptional activator ligand binding domain protein [Xanthobacteraceae bacterium]